MSSFIYGIIIILFFVYIFWTWNNTKYFDSFFTRVSYICIGSLFITLVTYIVFIISKVGIVYPNKEMIGELRNIILLTFVPINGFLTLPQIANTIKLIKDDEITSEKFKRKMIVFIICILIVIIFESYYFKNIQNGIIQKINLR